MDATEVSRETLISRHFPGNEEKIRLYADFLLREGVKRGLIGPREGDRIWERHIFNSLPVMELIPQGASVIDIGSGAGLPGIPLALARPDLSMVLIEPLKRRVDFLLEAVRELPIHVMHGRAEDATIKSDVVTARAVASFEKLKKMSWHLLSKGGVLLAIKGESAAQEVMAISGAHLHEIELEGLPIGRVILLKKSA